MKAECNRCDIRGTTSPGLDKKRTKTKNAASSNDGKINIRSLLNVSSFFSRSFGIGSSWTGALSGCGGRLLLYNPMCHAFVLDCVERRCRSHGSAERVGSCVGSFSDGLWEVSDLDQGSSGSRTRIGGLVRSGPNDRDKSV